MEKGVTALDSRVRASRAFGVLATDVLRGNWWRDDAERYSKRESSSLGIDAAIMQVLFRFRFQIRKARKCLVTYISSDAVFGLRSGVWVVPAACRLCPCLFC